MRWHLALAAALIGVWSITVHAASTIVPNLLPVGIPANAGLINQNFGNAINDVNALQTQNAGVTAPSNPSAGNLWLSIPQNSTTFTLNEWDGKSWVPIGSFDSVNHIWMPPIGGGVPPTILSATTTDLGSVPQATVSISGVNAIQSFGTSAPAGTIKVVLFTAATPLINSASLILPEDINITQTAGSNISALALGGGVWRVLFDSDIAAPTFNITGGAVAGNNAALEVLPSTATSFVTRLGFATPGDAPTLGFIPSASACSLNAGAGDGGSQVPSADSKCWLAQFSATGADWREWGVKFDNSTNNSAALQAADTWAPANAGTLVGPAGIARFSTPLVVDAAGNGNWSWRGSQKSTTEFLYTGGSSDIITAGNSGGTFMNYVNISDIYVDSINQLSSGYALHLNYTNFSTLHNIRIGGQQGNGNLWNSIYFDGFYNDTISGNSDISGQNVGISVAGLGSDGANLLIEDNTNIVPPVSKNGCVNNAAVCEKIGLLMGGGAGGVVCSGANFEANGVNWQVDESLTGTANREFSLVGGCIIDSTRGGDDVLLNDANAGDAAQAILANWWIASACSSSATITPTCSGSGVHVENYLNGNVAIKTGVIWNIANGDAIRIDDATTKVKIDPGTLLHDFTGYGINCTVSTTNVYPGSFPHDDGRSWTGMYAPDCNLASGLGTNNGYLRNPDGTYREWQQVTFASGQLANTQLLPTGGTGSPPVMVALPLPFPNGWNGQPVCTVSAATSSTGLAALYASSSGSSAFNLYGVSNVNLTNPMTASCDSFGY